MSVIDVRNPATNQIVGQVASAMPSDVGAAVSRARAAQKIWARKPFAERAGVITRFHDLMLDRSSRVYDTIQSETGKTRRDAFGELGTVAGTARYYIAHGEEHLAPKRKR